MIHFKLIQYLRNRGYLKPGSRIMDIGTQNLLFAEEGPAIALVQNLRRTPLTKAEVETVRKICAVSVPQPGVRTAFLHELLALTDTEYQSIDIVDGLKTTILDLNYEVPLPEWRKHFDLVLNCGTLEHVINQHNALMFIHDVLEVGGVWFDQPPSVGFLNHGYFNYQPLFYRDLAHANRYELLEAWYSHAGSYPALDAQFPIIAIDQLDQPSECEKAARPPFGLATHGAEHAPSYNFNVFLKKTVDEHLRLPLEVRTTHGTIPNNLQDQYRTSIFDSRWIK